MKQRHTLATALLAAAVMVVLSCTSCGRTEVKITHRNDVIGPSWSEQENVPRPWVAGGYGYDGYGHFFLLNADNTPGASFYWRDGHFVWADGSLMGVEPWLADDLTDQGIKNGDQQPSIANSSDWVGVPDFSDLTSKEALFYSVHCLSGMGWWVRHTYIDSQKPLAVTFAVDDADNGPFIEDILLRHFLYARMHGLSVDELGIEYKSRPNLGHRDLTPSEGMAQAAAKLWPTPPAGADNKALQATIAARLPGEADDPGCTVKSLEVTTTYLESRRVTLAIAVAGGQSPRDQAEGYAADVLALIQALNADEGAGIAVLRFDAFDASGAPLARERWDLDLEHHSSL